MPPGSGRASGRRTDGAGDSQIAYDEVSPAAPRKPADTLKPATAGGSDARDAAQVVPVFLDTGGRGEDAVVGKPSHRPLSPRDLLHPNCALDLLNPAGAPLPWPGPLPPTEPAPATHPDDDDGLDGPAMQNDRGGGGPKAQAYEVFIAALVNPSNPTPKKTPQNPNIRSQAFYLPQPFMRTGNVALDDCKRTSEPSPILGIKKGTMVEV